MGLARDLVELEAGLRDAPGIDLFAPKERSGLLENAAFGALLGRATIADSGSILRLCLQALRIQFQEFQPRLLDAELVATLPPETPGIARPTESVVRELVNGAGKEIILLGYQLKDGRVVGLLADAVTRGVQVIVICDRGTTDHVWEAWPPGVPFARVFHDRDRADGAPYASMHAKCLLVDGRDLLITSANFTFHGLHGNVEIGVRLSGPPAGEARKIFSHLVETRIVEEVSAPG